MNLLRCFLLLSAYRRASVSMPLACLGLIFVLFVVGRMQRPQLFGEVFFAALLLVLSRPVLSRRALVLVPIDLVLWANIHGSYAAGLALLGLFFLGRFLSTVRDSTSSRWAAIVNDLQVRRLFLVGMTSTLGIALLNPHGPWMFLHTLRFSRNPNIPTMDEWKPLDLNWGPGDHWVYLATVVLVVVTRILSPRILSPTCLLLCFSFGVFPLWQRRLLIWWFVLFPWIVLPAWAEIGRRLPWSRLHYRSEATSRKTVLATVFLLVAVLWSPLVQWLRGGQPRSLDRSLSPGTPWRLAAQLKASPSPSPPHRKGGEGGVRGGDKSYLPQLADALRQGYPDGRFQGRIFASETQGDYLLWALPPDYPVLVYTHVHLISPQHWRDCLTVLAAEPRWRKILDRHSVNLVVVEVEDHPQLTKALKADPDWQIVLDETGLRSKVDPRTRLIVALRKSPLP